MTSEQITPVQSEMTLSVAEYDELRESRRRFATLLSNLPGMAYRYAKDAWTFEFVSEGCVELTGYAVEDLLSGRITWADLEPDDERIRNQREIFDAVRAGRPYQNTFQIVTASGETKWVWEQGQGIIDQDGSLVAFEGFITDVTERVEAHDLLEARVAERTHELEMMLDVSRSVASTLELEPLLEAIIDQISRVMDSNAVSIGLIDEDGLVVVASRRDMTGAQSQSAVGLRFVIDSSDRIWREITAGRTIYSPNVRGDDPVARAYRARVGDLLDTVFRHVCSWMAAPLIAKDRLIGAIFISSIQEDHYGPHDMDLTIATANQIAIAIENARLHEQARRLAAIEERQRLARELHDSVSQALFGIGLGAQTALAVAERNPDQVIDPLRYILELSNTGLAEMRALIFELRPESLEQEGLVRAIEKQVAALRARYRLAIEAELGPEPDAPLAVKEALYRIAQEAMHNAIKHASPRTIRLQLDLQDESIEFVVTDDGLGFDPSASFPGHLGLKSMPERAQHLGGQVAITSTPGAGTRVRASIPTSRVR